MSAEDESDAKKIEYVPTQEGYDRWAKTYDEEDNPLIAIEESVFHKLLGDVSDQRVLELGCGTGRHTKHMIKNGAEVTAIDFSTQMLLAAKKQIGDGDKVKFIHHNLENKLPFADETFDLVASSLVLEHIKEIDYFFCEAQRVVKNGGRLIFSTMHPAMFLRDKQAHFFDTNVQTEIRFESFDHQVSDFINAAIKSGLKINDVREYRPSQTTVRQSPKATKFINWPLLFTMDMTRIMDKLNDNFKKYVILLTKVDGKETSKELIQKHVSFLKELDNRGQLAMCGPFSTYPGGMLIINTNSLDIANSIASSDPFVKEGTRTFEVREWQLSCKENNHLGMG